MDICIGIDLGTTFSAVSFWNNDHCEIIPNKDGKNITPSYVSFTNNEILVGDAAKTRALINVENTLFDIKRIIGQRYNDDKFQEDIFNSNYPFKIDGDSNNTPYITVNYKDKKLILKPEQISGMVLSYLKETAEDKIGHKITKAVITVPAYFNNSQREATKQAATIAGLECLRILNEPTAACLCYGIDKKYNNSANILVFDLGGGTFDVSILKLESSIFTVLSTSGNTHLGGEDFDNILTEFIITDFNKKAGFELKRTNKNLRKIKNISEKAKIALSTANEYLIELDIEGFEYLYEIKRKTFEKLCENIFNLCLEPVIIALKDANLNKIDIDEIVLVGGSTRIPKIRELLSNFFNGKILNMSVHPDEAVALGAGIQGAILMKNDISDKTGDILLCDIIPLSLGIETKGGVMSKIIPKNSQIPTKKKQMYTTSEDKQTSIQIKVYEGEREFVKNNHKLGDVDLIHIPKMPRGSAKIEICFEVDSNGILSIYATELTSFISTTVVISNSTKLSQDEINKMVDDADKYRADDELKKNALLSKNNYSKYLYEIQRVINNRELIIDENNESILSEDILLNLNKCIISNLSWLDDDDDQFILTKETIDNTRIEFENSIKGYLNKIYLRKQEIELKKSYIKNEDELDINTLVNKLDEE